MRISVSSRDYTQCSTHKHFVRAHPKSHTSAHHCYNPEHIVRTRSSWPPDLNTQHLLLRSIYLCTCNLIRKCESLVDAIRPLMGLWLVSWSSNGRSKERYVGNHQSQRNNTHVIDFYQSLIVITFKHFWTINSLQVGTVPQTLYTQVHFW